MEENNEKGWFDKIPTNPVFESAFWTAFEKANGSDENVFSLLVKNFFKSILQWIVAILFVAVVLYVGCSFFGFIGQIFNLP